MLRSRLLPTRIEPSDDEVNRALLGLLRASAWVFGTFGALGGVLTIVLVIGSK